MSHISHSRQVCNPRGCLEYLLICFPLKDPCKLEPEQQNGFHPACVKGDDMAASRAGPHSDGEETSRNKKPKLEARPHSDCDTDSDLEEDIERVTNLLTAGGGSPGTQPF